MTHQAPAAEHHDIVEGLVARMRAHGDRATPARLLPRALADKPGHLSAKRLAAEVRARAPGVSITTTCRNLGELERLKVVDRTRPAHGPPPATWQLPHTATWPARSAERSPKRPASCSPASPTKPAESTGSRSDPTGPP